jgi:hypothetical protein
MNTILNLWFFLTFALIALICLCKVKISWRDFVCFIIGMLFIGTPSLVMVAMIGKLLK